MTLIDKMTEMKSLKEHLGIGEIYIYEGWALLEDSDVKDAILKYGEEEFYIKDEGTLVYKKDLNISTDYKTIISDNDVCFLNSSYDSGNTSMAAYLDLALEYLQHIQEKRKNDTSK